jgi:site-specific recombinase XerD
MGRSMTSIRLKYIKSYRRNGKTYYYFRRKGCPAIALPGEPGSRSFNQGYEAALTEKPLPVSRHDAWTLGRLVADYYGSVDFLNLKPSSRTLYRIVLDPISRQHGHRKVKEMGRENARKIVEAIGSTKPGMANLTRAILKRLLRYAVDRGWRNDNPMAGVAAYRGNRRHTWTTEECAQYEAFWPIGTQERLDYAAYRYTAQRGGDVIRIPRSCVTTRVISLEQQKTGQRITIPVHPELLRAAKAVPAKGLTLITNSLGRPIKRPALTLRIMRAAKAAGLPVRCKPHGLRKAFMKDAAENEATTHEIAGVSGHKSLKEIQNYTEEASRERLAIKAMRKVSNGSKVRHLRGRK